MKSKDEIVKNWLPRYTGVELKDFGEYILLTNFDNYVYKFADMFHTDVKGVTKAMSSATADNITIINFGMGSANAATVMDLLSAIQPKAVLFLGKCGALRSRYELGSFILPLAGIRGEGASNDYFPPEVPALPAFALQRAVSSTIRDQNVDYWTGTVYTTNRRVWEHDEDFKQYLQKIRASAIDMETATLLTVGFSNKISIGALLLVTDHPMTPQGVKTSDSDNMVTKNFVDQQIKIGVGALSEIKNDGRSVRHLLWR